MVKILILMLLTQFSFYFAPVTHSRRSPDRDVTLPEVYSYVTGNAAKDKTIELRGLSTKEEKDDYKKNYLDFCSFSGQFGEYRNKECLIKHSGILMLDIDNLPVDPEEAKDKLLKDTNFTPLLMFTSPKGNGLKVAVQIDMTKASMEQYVDAFHCYFMQKYGYEVDTHCKDVARACFLPWDPSAVLNDTDAPVIFDPQKYILALKTHKRVSYTQSSADLQERVENVINEISISRVSIAPSYEEYLNVGFALADSFGESGRNYFHQVCRLDPKYNREDADKQYTNCLKSTGHGITIATFFAMAKNHGIEISNKKDIPFAPSTESNERKDDSEPELPTFSRSIKELLPQFGRKVVERFTNEKDADIITLGWLAISSSLLPGISGIYDEKIVFPHMYVFVEGYPASGKGHLSLIRELITPVEEDERNAYRQALTEYREKHREWEISDRREPEPEEPRRKVLCIPADSTAAAFMGQLNDNDGEALVFESEADTLVHALSSPYGHYSEVFRKAFHHETISRIRSHEKEYTNIRQPRIALCLTGTPDQTGSLVKGMEDGLASRFIFYHLPYNIKWRDPFSNSEKQPLNTYYKALGINYYEQYYSQMLKWNDVLFILTDSQKIQFNDVFRNTLNAGVKDVGQDITSTIFRLGLTTFRIAMVLSTIRSIELAEPLSGIVECDDESFKAAIEISRVILEHDIYVLSHMPKSPVQFKTERIRKFYDALPPEFNFEKYRQVALSIGMNPETVRRYITQLVSQGLIIKTDTNNYYKSNTRI